MNYKRVLILCIVTLIIVSTISVVSAGWFDFLGGEKNATTLNCSSGEERIYISIDAAETSDLSLENNDMAVSVNVTDENNHTEQYTCDVWSFYSNPTNHIFGSVDNLTPGNYTVVAYFPGTSSFKEASWNGTVEVKQKEEVKLSNVSSSNDSSNDPSTEVVSTETTQEGGLTVTTTTYADGHTKVVKSGTVTVGAGQHVGTM